MSGVSGVGVDLDRSWAEFTGLVRGAAAELERGRLERAAVAAQVAAAYAWFNHPGVFASRELEEVVAGIGRRVADGGRRPGPGGVVHVATEVYGTGGHTRMLVNWIAADDPGAEHHVCLTGQRGRPVPPALLDALAGRGRVWSLDAKHDGLVARARALRALVASAASVVLHVHPHDVVPGIALCTDRRRAPVLAVDHADHVFWVGTAVPDRVLHLRRSGADLALARRGITPDRSGRLVRPLAPVQRNRTRAEARAALGVPDGRTVLVTAAAGSKYEPVGGVGFLDVVRPVLDRHPDAFLLAAGPAPTGEWAALGGRGRATGLLDDVRPVLEAADVYLDSYPFSSLTSMLEAAALGVPVVTLRPPDPGCDVLAADTPELEGLLVEAASPDHLAREVGRLLSHRAGRDDLGARTGRAVAAAHADGAWLRGARTALGSASPRRRPPVVGEPARGAGPLDHRVAELQRQSGWGQGVHGAERLVAGLLPLRRRLVLAADALAHGQRPAVVELVSTRTARRLRAGRARLRRS